MLENFAHYFFFFDIIAFLAVVLMAIAKSHRNLIRFYFLQSLSVSFVLAAAGLAEGEQSLVWVAALTFLVKCLVAPRFFSRVLSRSGMPNSSAQFLSLPFTLLALLALVLAAYSNVFEPLGLFLPGAFGSVSLNLAMVFIAIFIMVNARGAFAQMLGVLSLENAIVLLATLFGIQSPLALEIGIIFDIVVWMIVSSVFIAMIYRQFRSLDTAHLRHLTEE